MEYKISVLEYLEESAEKFPDKLAFIDDKISVSFSKLLSYSKVIGTYISKKTNMKIRRPIMVLVRNDVYDISAFMGILQSGNFYVPIDEKTPVDRLNMIIDKLNPLMILHHGNFNRDYFSSNIEDLLDGETDEVRLAQIRSKIIDTDPVYTIFTSGSTGVPKGIVISNRSVIDLAEWLSTSFDFSDKDILGNQTPFYFDASVKEIYLTLRNSLTTYIIPKRLFMFPIKLIEFLNENKISSILWATSAMNLVVTSKVMEKKTPEFLNKVFFAGETMYAKVLNVWREACQNARFVNLYGPTEITVDCSYYEVNREFNDDEVVPIGRNCRNKEIIILDENLKETDCGEVCVRGTGVALGYYGEVEKTNSVFIQNPSNKFYRDIIYRTGDIAKINEYGELVFICRKDNQVKHMGYRIELGEIEACAMGIESIINAVCIFNSTEDKIILICEGDALDSSHIMTELTNKLPKYMLPNYIDVVSHMPLNSNGKIDRVRLKELYLDE